MSSMLNINPSTRNILIYCPDRILMSEVYIACILIISMTNSCAVEHLIFARWCGNKFEVRL